MNPTIRILWLLNVFANAILAILAWVWLGIPDARGWQLGITALLGILMLFAFLWLHASNFRFFNDKQLGVPSAFRDALRRVPLFGLWAAVFVAAEILVHIPTSDNAVVKTAMWIAAWIVVPAALLPLGSFAAGDSLRLREIYQSWRYWTLIVILLIAGIYLPFRLIAWVPALQGVTAEAFSFAARWLVAYGLLVAAWLTAAYVTSAGKPRWIHPNTASLP